MIPFTTFSSLESLKSAHALAKSMKKAVANLIVNLSLYVEAHVFRHFSSKPMAPYRLGHTGDMIRARLLLSIRILHGGTRRSASVPSIRGKEQ